MCGIAGIVSLTEPVERDVLRRMTNSLARRGPDDENYFFSPPEIGASVGLGFRRLSIIDLGGGRQPMCNEDGSIWIVCNGEIYNFRELRPALEAKGHVFRTNSDVEILLHLYEEHGEECVDKVNGMFAFALWDSARRKLLLARDRLGKKPLYYRDGAGPFLFASEPKALLRHPSCSAALDRAALARYLALEYVPSPHCIYRGVGKVPAGHLLIWKNGQTRVRKYWDLKFSPVPGVRSDDEIAEELLVRFKEAVRLRLISDVPLGVFLSGGIDSSSVVAMMAELMPAAQIKTFSIGFDEKSFDESAHARRVARFFGTEHHEKTLRSGTLVEVLPEVAAFLDEPLADASVIPTYLLSRFTREHVTVALGGDGGDELFAGYPTFQAHRMARFYRVPPFIHHKIIEPLAGLLPVSTDNFSFDFKVKRFLRGAPFQAAIRDQVWLGSFMPEEQRELLCDLPQEDPYADVLAAEAECRSRDPLERLSYLYCKFYLQEDILVKVDRASMACSLEARAPFLDYTFVEFAASIPSRLKLHNLTGKYILKRAMKKRLPPEVLSRGKKGFGIPVAKWFRSDLRELVSDTFSESRIRRQGIFEPRTVTRLLEEHLRGRRDNRKQLWTLFIFQLWYERFVESEPAPPRVQTISA